MRKLFSTALTMILVLAMLAGCSGQAGNQGNSPSQEPQETETKDSGNSNSESPAADEQLQGTITMATHRIEQADTDLKRYAEDFMAKHPGTEIVIEAIKDYDKTMRVRMAAHEMPDVLSMVVTTQEEIPLFYEPLDDIGLNDQVYFREASSVDGKLYGITQQVAINGLVYNKKAFSQAGISEAPKTWDDVLAASEKLKAAGIVPFSTAFKDAWTLQYWTDPAYFFHGSPSLDNEMFKSDAPFVVDSPFGKALGLFKQLYDKGYLEKDIYSANWDQTLKDLASGKTAMMYIGNWLFAYLVQNGLAQEDIGFIPLPYDNSGTYQAYMQNDWNYAVSKDSKNKALAKAFVKYLVTESDDYKDHNLISPIKGAKSDIPQMAEFNSYNPTFMERQTIDPAIDAIMKKMQYDKMKLLQEVTVGNMQEVFDKYNQKWKTAKDAVNK